MKRLMVLLLAALLLSLVVAPAALALSERLCDRIGCVSARTYNDRHNVKVCDNRRDLQDATAAYHRKGSSITRYLDDENGVRDGCGHSSRGNRVVTLMVCFGSPLGSTRCET